jgi:M6 family metalloprotease-like protein
MIRKLPRFAFSLTFLLGLAWSLTAAEPTPAPATSPTKSANLPDLSEYRTLENAVTSRISRTVAPTASGHSGYLGLSTAPDPRGKLLITEVAPASPAARAGLQRGDLLVQVDGKPVVQTDVLREMLQARAPGEAIKVAVLRNDKPVEVTATLGATSRPMKLNAQRAILGLTVAEPKAGTPGVAIERVLSGSPADKAKLKVGETLLKLDGVAITGPDHLRDLLAEKKPDASVTLTLFLADKALDLKVQLALEDQGGGGRRGFGGGGGGGWDSRTATRWLLSKYRLAIVCIEYPDVKHNPKVAPKDWEEALFSSNTYVKKNNATGQPAHGSLNDYYQEQSYRNLRVEGKVFNWIEVSKKRADYSQGTGTGGPNRFALLTEALDKLLARDGKDALKDFDGIYFVYAGDRVQTSRGGLYWPHRSTVAHQGKRWAYFIMQEGGSRMADLSIACHEFGHMLGLPDLYARPENPGSEGLGVWCAMSNQLPNGRPQHFSAWCKEQLGWVKPVVVDPTVKQKLILAPIEDSPKECVKVLVKPDGTEYLLLENRRKKGFDENLPAEGLLIWRIVNNRPILEESHGVEGPAGPNVFRDLVPYPTPANDAFTPYTTPSSRSQLGGGLPVHITNIRKLPDGRITFHIGYEYN